MRPVRFGAISLLLLVATLALAVLGVLSLTTAHADKALADRQVENVQESYTLDAEGQAWVASVDASLNAAGAGASFDIARVSDLPADTTRDGNLISTTLKTAGERQLSITLQIESDGTYTIARWARSNSWQPNDDIGGNLL